MGDANMYWSASMADNQKVRLIHARHEHCCGAIGSGLPAAIGVAAARNDGKVMLIDGDGSLYQHIQELETVRRHGMKLLICIINEEAMGPKHINSEPMGSIRCTRRTAAATLPK